MTTLGTHSPRLTAARSLLTKAGRREQRSFLVEGATMLGEALRVALRPEAVYVTERGYAAIAAHLPELGGRVFTVDERSMRRLSDLEAPPGIVAVFPSALQEVEALLADGEPAIVLAGIADPGNAGTLLRSAEIFGIRSAIFTPDAVETYNPKAVRATMGAIFRMRLAVGDGSAIVSAGAKFGYTVVAAAGRGTPLPAFRFPSRSLLAIGSERHGVAHALSHVDVCVGIPQPGSGDSLNASVAGSIIFYAFSQQMSGKI